MDVNFGAGQAMPVSASEREEVERLIVRDVVGTLGTAYEVHILSVASTRALELFNFVESGHDFRSRLIDDVQQQIHDTFVDVRWPRCPRHPKHALWFADGSWTCTIDKVTVARLGQLCSVGAAKE